MDCATTLGCLGKYVLIALAIFGVICIISIQYSRKLNKGVKAAVEQQPKPKEGRVILREVVEGMNGMADSYIAEMRDHGDGDMRFHVYDANGHQIIEAPLNCALGLVKMSEDIKKWQGRMPGITDSKT